MPWKGEKDPYKIWLSEVILQQTRVEQGWPYFEKFVARFPDVHTLAAAHEDEVLKLWEGLGYYSRARNLHAAAQHLSRNLKGVFPSNYEGIRKLKGVGDYTAAAIAAFAFNLPHAVLDGNVYRVLSRFFAIDIPTDLPASKKEFAALAQAMLDPDRPADYNQAMMDFGATCCTPAQPGCHTCPLKTHCRAAQAGRVQELPVRAKKLKKKERYFLYLIVKQGAFTFLRKRTGNDIWRGLYEFPLLESEGPEGLHDIHATQQLLAAQLPAGWSLGKISDQFQQILTHRQVVAVFLDVHLPEEESPDFSQHSLLQNCILVPYSDVKKKFALPRVIVRFFEKND